MEGLEPPMLDETWGLSDTARKRKNIIGSILILMNNCMV